MKKSLIFASLIAIVAIFASCEQKPAGNAPKARFAYATDGLVVTFTNASKDAETYAWDFGDGSAISAEENPVHTYTAAGTYTVKLTAKNAAGENSATETITLEAKAFSIAIDGNFDDWKDLPADLLAEAKMGDMSVYEHLYDVKFITDADYIYFYFEYDATTDEDNNDKLFVGVMNLFIDSDDNPATGYACWLWENCGANFMLEGDFAIDENTGEEYWNPGIFQHFGDDQEAWDGAWQDVEAVGALTVSGVKSVATGRNAFEGKLMRAAFTGMTSLKVGVLGQGEGWSGENGVLPEIYVGAEGATVTSPMLEVKLN